MIEAKTKNSIKAAVKIIDDNVMETDCRVPENPTLSFYVDEVENGWSISLRGKRFNAKDGKEALSIIEEIFKAKK